MVQDVAQAAGITDEDRSWSLVDDCFDMTLHHTVFHIEVLFSACLTVSQWLSLQDPNKDFLDQRAKDRLECTMDFVVGP